MEGVEWRTARGIKSRKGLPPTPPQIDRQTTRSEKRRRGEPLFFRATVSKEAGNSCAAVADDDKLFFGAAGRKVEGEGGGGRSRLPLFLFLLSLSCALFSPSYRTLSTRPRCRRGRPRRRGRTRGAKWRRSTVGGVLARPPVGRSVGRRGIPLSISLLLLLLERGEWTGRRPSFLRPIDRRKEGGAAATALFPLPPPPPPVFSPLLRLSQCCECWKGGRRGRERTLRGECSARDIGRLEVVRCRERPRP